MPKPIVVGFDGSEHARDALALGRTLAATLRTRLIVVNAYTPQELLWASGTAQPLDEQERKHVMDAAEAELSEQDRYELRSVASPSAAGALHATAESEQAQVIVVGSTHRGTLGRVLLGTVTQEVLDAAPCAVLVAPAGLAAAREPIGLARIGVGFDHTPQVYDVRTEIASGGTVAALVRHSQDVDLLVLGSRSYGPLERVLLGSVSRAVVNNAHCPVLVVPRGVTALDENALVAQADESATGPESVEHPLPAR